MGQLGLGGAAHKVLLSMHAKGWQVQGIDVTSGDHVEAPFEVTSVPLDRVMWCAARSPLRYRPDLLLNLGNGLFDRLASSRIGETDVFYGFSMAAMLCMRAVRSKTPLRVLLAAPTYLPRVQESLEIEYARIGAGSQPFNKAAVTKAVAEYYEADLIRAESHLARESLVEGGVSDSKIFVLPPSVDLESFRPAEHPLRRFTIAFVGGFNPRKGLHHLLEAWDLVHQDDDQLLLHGGGDGWAKKIVAPYAGWPNVRITRGAPHETLRSASVCVCPSLEDAFCNVVLEAMASGVPVIISDQVGAMDLVQDGREGFIVPAGGVSAIAERINYLREHPAERAEMGAAARRRAEACSLGTEGTGLDQIFRLALNGRV
jgi:glycosyltransferase involved in cell wall biosynthesis